MAAPATPPDRAQEAAQRSPTPRAPHTPASEQARAAPPHHTAHSAKAPDRAAPPPPATASPAATSLRAWHLSGEAVTGLSHRRKHLPCQDAIAWRNSSRPILVLSDGAGSAAISEKGAATLVTGIPRFLNSLEHDLAAWLDTPTPPAPQHAASWAERLRLHAQGLLEDLAQAERRNVRDLRATLLLAVVGHTHSFWWQVGDGAIVARQANRLRKLGDPTRSKGEFANQTCFADKISSTDLQWGLLPSAELTGLALMSDGGAERLVSSDGQQIATRLEQWLNAVADDSLPPDQIALAFHAPAMWERTSLDDRAIVMAARSAHNGEATTA